MIRDKVRYIEMLKDLLEYYKRPSNKTALAVWLATCDRALSDEEFYEAVSLCFRKCDRIPPIDEFIGLVKGSSQAKLEASNAEAWNRVIQGAAIATSTLPEHLAKKQEILSDLSYSQLKALEELGGLSAIGRIEADNLHWKKKDFLAGCKLHEQATGSQQRRLGGQLSKAIKEGDTLS